MFKLDKRLESDTILVKELKSFQVRLMNAKEFFWIVLIPNKPNLIELSDLERLQETMTRVQEDGKRYYQTPEGQKYPSVTTVTGLLSKDHIKLWRKRVGEETANKITKQATTRGTRMHNIFEQYLRAEEPIFFDNIMESSMFEAVQPVLDEIIPIALEAGMYLSLIHI